MNARTHRHEVLDPSFDVCSTIGDLRFRGLLSAAEWIALPYPVRRRFSERVAGGDTVVYAGEVVATRRTRFGRWFAQAARLVGGPLPLFDDTPVPAVVTVTEDRVTGGQIWTRLYARERGFPQVIASSKRFAGATGLEEYVGGGVGMALRVTVENQALVFRSAGYFFRLGWLSLTLPWWLTPGALSVTHAEEAGGRFSFTLVVVHPLFGEIIRQVALFKEVTP